MIEMYPVFRDYSWYIWIENEQKWDPSYGVGRLYAGSYVKKFARFGPPDLYFVSPLGVGPLRTPPC